MTNYGTIKLPRDAYERHNERRQERGLTWAEYVDGQAPDLPDAEKLVDAIAAEADGQGRVDDSALAREVARKIDYAELANAVADELEARQR